MKNRTSLFRGIIAALFALFCLALAALAGCAFLRGRGLINPTGGTPTTGISPTASPSLEPAATPPPSVVSTTPPKPDGKIVFACQVFAEQYRDQICIMNADGSGYHRLTFDDDAENYYPSLSPDGNSLVYSSNRTGSYEIYEMDLTSGTLNRLTDKIGEVGGPEISPDGRHIVFTNILAGLARIWIMNRDGSDPHEVYSRVGADSLDPTWSPDGTKILFASGIGNEKQLYTINPDGSGLHLVSAAFRTRGRSDWSPNGSWIASYAGSPWHWEIFRMNADGTDLHQISSGGSVLAPAFSPDSQWIVFTGYIDNYENPDGCEIYIMRIDGSQITRLTYNDYCDWQPRWGS